MKDKQIIVRPSRKKGIDRNETRLEWLDKDKHRIVKAPVLPFQTVERLDTSNKADKKWANRLIWGDNKFVMASLLPKLKGKIDLIYIDPPFATGADFSIKVKIGDLDFIKEPSIIEEKAYRDTWGRGVDSYLQMLYDRLALMKELLAETGSIYVHLDWRMDSYVRLIMEELFNFRNELIWAYRTGGASTKNSYARKHDCLLFYSKSKEIKFNPLYQREYYEKPFFTPKQDKKGRYYADVLLRDILEGKIEVVENGEIRKISVKPVLNVSTERLDYDTQKPEGLLQILMSVSTKKDDLVADFFCGSGTTLAVAEKLGRRWIGCDLSKFAIHTTRKRLLDIQNSKDLLSDGKKKYGKPARPFVIQNLGNYESHKLLVDEGGKKNIEGYIQFILDLYRAKRLEGYRFLHGEKNGRYVHIGALDSAVTLNEVLGVVKELKTTKVKEVDTLGWGFVNGLDLELEKIAKTKNVLVRLFRIPKEVMQVKDPFKEQVDFYEFPRLEIKYKTKGRTATLKLADFNIYNLDEIKPEVLKKLNAYTDLIDYWAIDWDYKGVFESEEQAFRTKKNPKLKTELGHTYKKRGKKRIVVKVVDIFGNDVNKEIEVKIA